MNELPSLADLKRLYISEEKTLPPRIENLLAKDSRIGAKKLLLQIKRLEDAKREEMLRLNEISRYENDYWGDGYEFIAGIDEVGCAPLAGPVLAAAVILPKWSKIEKVNDSKKLSASLREKLAQEIKKTSIAWGIGMASPEEIAKLNIYHADLLAMKRAIQNLSIKPEFLLVDGRKLEEVDIPQLKIVRGDQKSISIASASIIAKVTRDALMADYDKLYPGYTFSKNKGYATLEHIDALGRLGVSPIHRVSWNAVTEYAKNQIKE